jgi:hypothetical protein
MVITFCFYQFLIGRLWHGPVQISQYSALESQPIKAGQSVATAQLVTAGGELNIFRMK